MECQTKPHIGAMLLPIAMAAACSGAVASTTGSGDQERPYAKADASWISLSGEVTDTYRDGFRMDYGDGIISVEMDNWDLDQEGQALITGDDVTVYGRVDADLYQTRTIEADSVFVAGIDTYFYASGADEEALNNITPYTFTVPDDEDSYVTITGHIIGVQGREMTVDTGANQLKVDTAQMTYNPLDDTGYQKVDKGDHVSVAGELDDSFFEDLELDATSVVTLADGGSTS